MPTSLGVNDLVHVFGRRVFERGLQYAGAGAVFSLRREGNILRGQVMGSQLYQTSFQIIPPYECWCTCPYDDSCKHAAALVMTWLRREEAGDGCSRATSQNDSIRDSIRDQLGRLSESELFNLIVGLIDTVPGARAATEELLLQRDIEGMGRVPGLAQQEVEAVRSALRLLVMGAPIDPEDDEEEDDDWEEDWEEDWEDDSEEDWKHHLGIEDERNEELLSLDGQINALISSIEAHSLPDSLPFRVLALVGCSVELVQAGERLSIAARWSWQIERMVKTVSDLVAEPACPDEVIEKALSELLDCYHQSGFSRGDLLKPALVGVASDPGRREWLLGKVVERSCIAGGSGLKRLHELAGEIQASSGDLRAALESFRKADASAEALLELARKCQQLGDIEATVEACRMTVAAAVLWNVADWRDRAAKVLMAAGDRAGARAHYLENFREAPSLGAAQRVLDTAEVPEERQKMAAELIVKLGKSREQALKVRLHLEAGSPRSALWALKEMNEYMPELHVKVAAGIAEVDIDAAIELWTKAVNHFVGRKNRSAYAEAAQVLVTMRKSLGQAGQWTRWQQYYWDLQTRYRSYRALKDELERAAL